MLSIYLRFLTIISRLRRHLGRMTTKSRFKNHNTPSDVVVQEGTRHLVSFLEGNPLIDSERIRKQVEESIEGSKEDPDRHSQVAEVLQESAKKRTYDIKPIGSSLFQNQHPKLLVTFWKWLSRPKVKFGCRRLEWKCVSAQIIRSLLILILTSEGLGVENHTREPLSVGNFESALSTLTKVSYQVRIVDRVFLEPLRVAPVYQA